MKMLRTALILAALMLAVPASASAADPLMITSATNHTGYVDLQGYRIASATTNVCITLSNNPVKTGPVKFYLDGSGTVYHQEGSAPWDMLSGGTNDATGACRLGTLPTGNHSVRATWTGGEDTSTFTVGPAPDTSISSVADADSAPTFIDEDSNGSEQVNVTFSGTNSVNRRECSISGATTQAFTTCTSVWSPTVNVGVNTVSVRACDNAGCDATPATNTFTMQAGSGDTTPPDTTITSAPSGATSSTSASIGFTGTDNVGVTGFECKLDAGAYAACTSPQPYSGLADGSHTVSVRAKDAAGNVDATPAIATWTVDATAPNTTIDSGPSGATNNASPSFAFSSTESGSFECRIDGAAFASCTSPKAYTALADGSHTFDVRAIDAVGNVDASPASRAFTVDTVVPDTTITAQPANPTTATTADFSFTSSETATFQCSLDAAAYATCTSPKSYTGLGAGSHTFTVKATDAASNTDATPASYTWTIQAPASDRLEYTTRTDHTGYSDLAGATLQPNTQYCVTLKSAADVVAPVNFYLDGTLMRTENTAPWDATNTLTSGACGTTSFSSGSHTISATWPNGGSTADTFSVATPPAQCADGIDNDADGKIDYPADPGCSSAADNDETDASGSAPWGPAGSWRLVFEDDFTQDAAGAIDANKWTNNGWNNCTTSVADGAPGGGRALDMYLPTTADNNGCQIRSKFAFTYGAIEARVYFPITPDGRAANHAGWWTYGNTSSSGEIDVMESGWCFIHNGSGGNATQGSVAGTWVGAWHTFTASWELDGTVKIWWDGQLACNASNLGLDNQPVNVLFNHFIQPGYNLYAPTHMWAQYARVWQH